MLCLWPPTNGRFGWKFNEDDAQEVRARGWILLDGMEIADVISDDGTYPELVQFQLREWSYYVPR